MASSLCSHGLRNMSNRREALVIFLALLLLSLSQISSQHGGPSGPEEDDESDFNYIEGSGKGPEDWWRLREGWKICKFGRRQSPINVDTGKAREDFNLGFLKHYFRPNHGILRNRGHDVMLSWPGSGGSLVIEGRKYTLLQCHWHSPAEHKIDGQSHDLELHLVHQTPDNKIAVIGILYDIGSQPDPLLSQLTIPLTRLVNGQKNVTVRSVAPPSLNGGLGRPYYRYQGSLTTPPCTEGVVWTVVDPVRSVSAHQVQLLRKAVHDGATNNARPIQPTNGRRITIPPWLGADEHPSS